MAGLSPTVFDAKGTVSGENQGMQEAIGSHAAAIVIHGITPSDVSVQIAATKKVKIPVVASDEPDFTGLAAHTVLDFTGIGKAEGAYVLVASGCNAHVGLLNTPALAGPLQLTNGAVSEIKSLCKSCTTVVQDMDLTAIATSTGLDTREILTSHPDTNWFIPAFDAIAEGVVPAIQAAHSKAKVVSNVGEPASLAFVCTGSGSQVDVPFTTGRGGLVRSRRRGAGRPG